MVDRCGPRASALVLAAILLLSALADAATLRIRFTLPAQDNRDTTCIAPDLLPMELPNTALKGHWRWWAAGADSVTMAAEDSTAGTPGTLLLRDYNVPQGVYRVRVWATDAGGGGCDTTVTTSPFKYRPWKPKWSP